ncbi:unnamed protein product [Phytophthora fragariaefolia]|uniref:Unnamed protein product n=1 Tax=Phytophthora fragariaefolia TaxID=1490495 RepID=A0A9W6XQR4_9STRA|nr:unnamed protein product [Phytophthora fragariaefolia]
MSDNVARQSSSKWSPNTANRTLPPCKSFSTVPVCPYCTCAVDCASAPPKAIHIRLVRLGRENDGSHPPPYSIKRLDHSTAARPEDRARRRFRWRWRAGRRLEAESKKGKSKTDSPVVKTVTATCSSGARQEQDPKQQHQQGPAHQQDPTQRQRQEDLTEPFREQAPTAKTSSGCHLTGAGTYKSTNIASCSFIVVDSLTALAAMTLDLRAAKAGQPVGTTTFDTFKWEGPLVLASGSDLSVTGSGPLDGPCGLKINNRAVNGIAKNTDGFDLTKNDRKIYNEDDCMAMQPSTNTSFTNNCSCGDHGISIGSLGVDDTGRSSSRACRDMHLLMMDTINWTAA